MLKNLDDRAISYLGHTLEPKMRICHNELSELTFSYPSQIEGEKTEAYDLLTGMRIIDAKGIGQFVLTNPIQTDNGIVSLKECRAYSLEYEFTYKDMSLENGTYNFWNPFTPDGTIIGMILEDMPSWRVGYISPTLIGKYRTFSITDVNIFDFIKSTLQETYGCIFDFDTYSRTMHVRDVNEMIPSNAIYLSTQNLLTDIEIEEDTESVVTALGVYGAESVDIRSVNPMGTNRIYNLDAYMTTSNFDQVMIDKWNDWKTSFENNQLPYFNLTIEQALQISRYETEYAALITLQGELSKLESQQAVIIQAISNGLATQSDLTAVNQQISQKNIDISAKNSLLTSITGNISNLTAQLEAANRVTSFASFFTADEIIILDRYFRCDSITENSFVATEIESYASEDVMSQSSTSQFVITSANVEVVNHTGTKKFYIVRSGHLRNISLDLDAEIINGTLEVNTDNSFVFSGYLNTGTISGDSFPKGTISATGIIASVADSTTSLDFRTSSTMLYFTRNVTKYQKQAIEWELFEYGQNCLKKLSSPSYHFSVESANFFAIEEFESFLRNLKMGERVYLEIEDGKVLEPIVLAVDMDFDDLSNFSIQFSDTFSLNDSVLKVEDFLDQSVSMGRNLNYSKFNYNAFVNSGASTQVRDYMQSALDVAKNSIMSSSGQDISWGASGLRLREKIEGSLDTYDPKQIWMANKSIMFTRDNWQTAIMGIGEFKDKNLGDSFGIVLPSLVGTILASENLIVESAKQDGGVSVFRVDGDGASLHNASFDLYGASGGRINLDPTFGVLGGQVSNMFAFNPSSGAITGVQTKGGRSVSKIASLTSGDLPNPNFWLDMDGDIYLRGKIYADEGEFKGIVHADAGSFNGTVTATDFYFKNGNSVKTLLSTSENKTQISSDFLNLKGLSISSGLQTTLVIDSNGNISLNGNITMTGGSISWNSVNSDPTIATARSVADSAYSRSSTAATMATQIANGIYNEGTFINGREIFAPTIRANEFSVMPISEGGSVGGYNIYGYYNSKNHHLFRLGYFAGLSPTITFGSPDGAYAYWNFGQTEFTDIVRFRGTVDFSQATVVGL